MTSGRTTTDRPAAAMSSRQGGPSPGSGRRLRPALAAAVAVLVVAGAAAGLGGIRPATPAVPAPAPPPAVEPAAFAVTPPPGWTAPAPGAPALEVFGVPFARLAEAPPFAAGDCPVGAAPRGVAAAALVAVPAGTSVEQAAQAFARGAGESAYAGSAPQVAVGPPGPRPGDDEPGTWVEATVRTDGTASGAGGCRATDGAVGVLAVPRTQARDGSVGVAMLVVAADVGGGPGDAVPRSALTDLAASAVRPG
ncbi:hypothetical protein [Pseudonocardia sp. Ae505_Ps2]|uniref:hypothetical protein n=1 Tax=Pseudonocardia sp. Ae505_Ps2 TaxID=1885034 RepID=UPI00094EC0D9|nr:hypothetical protein [Pseudonocardia sp. Ae505_Ps2]